MFEHVPYGKINSRQQKSYNFQKIAARLADYGFNCLRLTDDWQGRIASPVMPIKSHFSRCR